MARYRRESEERHLLLLAAGVVGGLVAGAAVAHRIGGLRGARRLLAGRRRTLLAVAQALLPPGPLRTVLDVVGIDTLLAGAQRLVRSGARYDDDLDEYEVDDYAADDFERAAAGLEDDDEDDEDGDAGESHDATAGASDDPWDEDDESDDIEEDDEEDEDLWSPELVEEEVLAAFRRHPVLRRRALEISVDDDGVLELGGWVRSEREARLARRIARAVGGVDEVIDAIRVRETAPATDSTGGIAP